MALILPTEVKGSTGIIQGRRLIDKITQKRIVFGMTMTALLLMMSAAFYMAAMLVMSPDATIDATFAIVALCMAAAVLGFAILFERQITRARARQTVANAITDFHAESDADEIASLRDLDELLGEQDPYFGLQLAIALRDKARHFPIRAAEIAELREILEPNKDEKPAANPQVVHLTKIIGSLERGYSH